MIFFGVIWALCAFSVLAPENDRFLEVLNNAETNHVKKELFSFYHGGIEQRVHASFSPDSVIALANTFMGTPHKLGGLSRQGIDCSGLNMVVYKQFGIDLPRSCQEQARYGTIVPFQDELQPGDLVFFYNSYKSSKFITHTGIYIGDGEFIHASDSKGVTTSKVNDPYFWGERYLFATRLGTTSKDSL
ncbi:C40 family peptidase [Cytophagaceae bacterium ABcell3]|nr:C40 family peptidase [Cytophagaceae bacterium ABcell3]